MGKVVKALEKSQNDKGASRTQYKKVADMAEKGVERVGKLVSRSGKTSSKYSFGALKTSIGNCTYHEVKELPVQNQTIRFVSLIKNEEKGFWFQ